MEIPVEMVRCYRIAMLAVRPAWLLPFTLSTQVLGPHQPRHPVLADYKVAVPQFGMHSGRAIGLSTSAVD